MTDQPDWQRPHPLTIVVLVATFISSNAMPLIVVFAFGGGGLGFDTAALVAGGATVGSGVLGWYMTGYGITDEAVHYRAGVLRREAKSIPLNRIQQVSIAEPVIARAVGLAVVQVAEASADGDIEIRYLGKPDATSVTQRLRALAQQREASADYGGDSVSSLAPPPEPPAVELHSTPVVSLMKFHLASIVPGLSVIGVLTIAMAVVLVLGSGLAAAGAVLAVGAGVVGLASVVSTIGVVLTNGGFRLERSTRSLRVEAGLLSRRQVEVRPERIQTLTVTSGPIVRRLNLHQIAFSAATGKASKNNQLVHLSPAASTEDVVKIVQGSVDVDPAFGVDLESVSNLTIRRQLVRSTVGFVLLVVPGSVALWFLHPVAALVPSALWWPVSIWYASARHSRLGLSIDERRLVIRRGVLTHHLTQVPLSHVQSVSSRASFFQRRLGLASLRVSTAGIGPSNHVALPDLPAQRCRELVVELATVAAANVWELRN